MAGIGNKRQILKMTKMRFILRRATTSDADAVANVYSTSFRLLAFLPMLHTAELLAAAMRTWNHGTAERQQSKARHRSFVEALSESDKESA